MRTLYSIALYLLTPLVLLRLIYRGFRAPAYWRRWPERFGFLPPLGEQPLIWVHAVSVGEVQAAAPLVSALLESHPDHAMLITTTTPTGSDQVAKRFGDRVQHRYLPYDLPGAVRRFLGRARPRLGLIMETEIWPNLYTACRAAGVPVALVNARLSERSAAGYRRLAGLTRSTLAQLDWIAVQTEPDARRLIELGAVPERVTVTGNTKFDATLPGSVREQAEVLRRAWGSQRPVWIAASTHEGEDEIVLAAHRTICDRFHDCLLVLVPRHPERFERVAERLYKDAWWFARRSDNDSVNDKVQVYLGDTMGELLMLYATADVAFVGGSLVDVGGHNPLEPAALGHPILFGPHMYNFAGISSLLTEAGAARTVHDSDELSRAVIAWLDDASERAQWGERALQVVEHNRGARDRVLGHLERLLK